MRVRPLRADDAARVAEGWNAVLPYDPLNEERLRRLWLEAPNYEPGDVVVAEDSTGAVLGMAACAIRRSVEGADGGGSPEAFGRAFLTGFFAVEGEAGDAAAAELLAAVERRCEEAGKTEIRVTEYTGPYLYPGPDVRYERIRGLLERHGYRDVRTIEDVGVDLRAPWLDARVQSAWARVGEGLVLETWRPELLPPMRRFVAEGKMPAWFPVGWEKKFAEPDGATLILRTDDEILGWARYWPGKPTAGFGPILVLPRNRGRGYGGLLLLECMRRARDQGAQFMSAGWANTGFYIAHGWHITRRYAVLTKAIRRGKEAA